MTKGEREKQLTFAILDDRHANTVDRQQRDSSQVCVLPAELAFRMEAYPSTHGHDALERAGLSMWCGSRLGNGTASGWATDRSLFPTSTTHPIIPISCCVCAPWLAFGRISLVRLHGTGLLPGQ